MTITADKAVAFMNEAARYFGNRDTGGEDAAFWSNVTNQKNCEDIAALISSLVAERDQQRDLAERLKLEAQGHAQEARTANSTIYEIYQVLSGGKGGPGNWNGAEPARHYVAEAERLLAEARAGLERVMAADMRPIYRGMSTCADRVEIGPAGEIAQTVLASITPAGRAALSEGEP